MKITICGSIAFYENMQGLKREIEAIGHEIDLPPTEVPGPNDAPISVAEYYRLRKEAGDDEQWVWNRKAEAIMNHFRKIEWADAVLVANYAKNDIDGYVGGNTFLEMGVAFWLGKTIYLLNRIPDLPYREEILGMQPIVINGDIEKM